MRLVCAAAALLLALGLSTAVSAQTVGGSYAVHGTNLDGSPYSGTAVITRTSNSTCRIRWSTGSVSDGICMLANNAFAAAYRLEGVIGLVVYELRRDGTLDGGVSEYVTFSAPDEPCLTRIAVTVRQGNTACDAEALVTVTDSLLPEAKERTIVNLFARAASLGKSLPKVMPGRRVAISPVTLRISTGAVIFGSNVSSCDGPPCRKSSTTALSLTMRRVS